MIYSKIKMAGSNLAGQFCVNSSKNGVKTGHFEPGHFLFGRIEVH